MDTCEEKYNDLLNRLKAMADAQPEVTKAAIESLFSELKESEDERIRKKIIDYFRGSVGLGVSIGGVSVKDMVSWLEKQGESNETKAKMFLINKGYPIDANGKFPTYEEMYDIIKEGLEKQGEQNPVIVPKFRVGDIVRRKSDGLEAKVVNITNDNIEVKCADWTDFILDYKWEPIEQKPTDKVKPKFKVGDKIVEDNEFGMVGGEITDIDDTHYELNGGCRYIPIPHQDNYKLVEQRSADKVEPKFHKGDWVVSNLDKKARQISEVHFDEYNSYYVVDGRFVNLEVYDRLHHLWTVQDAKDGDILCTYECCEPKIVFILKGAPKKHYALSYHCYYNIMYPHFASDSEKGCLAPNDEDVKPATKEQREQLEKAMADAGYTFDFERKGLRKIEENPAWSEEDESILNALLINLKKSFEYNEEGYLKYESWIKLHCQPHHCSYNPYKVAIESIAEMCKHYGITSNSDLQDFYQNVKVKCKDAKEYDNMNPQSHWKPSDLPHWKKSTLTNDNTTGFNSDYFCHKGYNINYKELFEKLPKDD